MRKKEFQIVSAPFASGVSLLVSILLELNVKMTNMGPLYVADHWIDTEGGPVLSENAYDFFKDYFPALSRNGNKFTFDASIEGFWEHRLDLALHAHRPTILFIRDPRDAIFSLFRRDYKELMSFEEYLLTSSNWPDHFSEMFGLPPFETWAYYNLFWYYLSEKIDIKIVTFEKLKLFPQNEIKEILNFLGIERSAADIIKAVNNSSFENSSKKFFSKGKVDEWKEHYTPIQESLCNNDLVTYAMNIFGYKDIQSVNGVNAITEEYLDGDVVLDECVSMVLGGNTSNVECLSVLKKSLKEEKNNFTRLMHFSAAKISIIWLGLITDGKEYDRNLTEPIYKSLYHLNRFLYIPHIFHRFSDLYNLLGIACTLVEHGYKGYNILQYKKKYLAVAQRLGPLDIGYHSETELLKLFEVEGSAFWGRDISEVKKLLSMYVDKKPIFSTK
jgi:hypothetical protein